MDTATFLDTAVQAARAAGEVHKKYFNTEFQIRSKGYSYDLVTIADVEAEKKIVELVQNVFPDHNFFGEENSYPRTSSPYTWIIDPLDGTNNFASGLPIFCASVAVAQENEIVAGAIYDVTRDETYTAEKGKGAFLNGKRIRVAKVDDLKQSILITGFYYDRGKMMNETVDKIKDFFANSILGLRRLGSAALDLCYVASGRAAGFWEFELSPWDFAAGKLLVEEAGGKVTGRSGEPIDIFKKSYIVASNSRIHDRMLEILR